MNKSIFPKAALITLAVLAVSLFVGYTIESQNYAKTEGRIGQLEDGLETSLLFMMFMETHNQSDAMCNVLRTQINDSAQMTYNLYGEMEEGKATGLLVNYDTLRKKYFLANMRFYLMLREYMQSCGDPSLRPVMFFYSAYNVCPSCVAQGQVLDTVRYECKNVRVYAFPADVQDVPMLKYFAQYYGVTKTPSLVINDQRYEELMSKEKIESLVGCK